MNIVLTATETAKEANPETNNKYEVNSNFDESQLEAQNQLKIEKRNLMGSLQHN